MWIEEIQVYVNFVRDRIKIRDLSLSIIYNNNVSRTFRTRLTAV